MSHGFHQHACSTARALPVGVVLSLRGTQLAALALGLALVLIITSGGAG